MYMQSSPRKSLRIFYLAFFGVILESDCCFGYLEEYQLFLFPENEFLEQRSLTKIPLDFTFTFVNSITHYFRCLVIVVP